MTRDVVLDEEPWSYVAFEAGDRYYLTYLSGGAIEVETTVELDQQEGAALARGERIAGELVARLKASKITRPRVTPSRWPRQENGH